MTSAIGLPITQYATAADLLAYLGPEYATPVDPDASRLLMRASELLYEVTNRRSQLAWDGTIYQYAYSGYIPPSPYAVPPYTTANYQQALTLACVAQVEFWLETGEEHDIEGLRGSITVGKMLNISQLPDRLAPRAKRALRQVNLLSATTFAR
jgi:hypothetical protein